MLTDVQKVLAQGGHDKGWFAWAHSDGSVYIERLYPLSGLAETLRAAMHLARDFRAHGFEVTREREVLRITERAKRMPLTQLISSGRTAGALLEEFLNFSELLSNFDIWESEAWRVRRVPSAESWYASHLVEPKVAQYMTRKQLIEAIGGSASGRAFSSRDFPNHPF